MNRLVGREVTNEIQPLPQTHLSNWIAVLTLVGLWKMESSNGNFFSITCIKDSDAKLWRRARLRRICWTKVKNFGGMLLNGFRRCVITLRYIDYEMMRMDCPISLLP